MHKRVAALFAVALLSFTLTAHVALASTDTPGVSPFLAVQAFIASIVDGAEAIIADVVATVNSGIASLESSGDSVSYSAAAAASQASSAASPAQPSPVEFVRAAAERGDHYPGYPAHRRERTADSRGDVGLGIDNLPHRSPRHPHRPEQRAFAHPERGFFRQPIPGRREPDRRPAIGDLQSRATALMRLPHSAAAHRTPSRQQTRSTTSPA